ncbi:MAG: hypothetical protein M3Y44_08665 [Actinomycetota bacterium]|nr:hypothetical protein [Actinomycetota bacterium]
MGGSAGVVDTRQGPARLVPLRDGPYQVTGSMEIVVADGRVIEPPTDTAVQMGISIDGYISGAPEEDVGGGAAQHADINRRPR